ncbi:hypothetical protein PanWU01x14_365500 [Parasponia andersonii]|uniref:Uncharacterized protein n=2 Tax=Parasponia andersonii TaxID=3476 RepID=A0A2P5A5Y0_PARAD|nr:hypothetical protein PanWU01x14_365500 [Parasponia andersonii]
MDSIEQSIMAYLRDWRNMMRNHFTKMGGKRDMAFIKANPYKNVSFDQWNILCDRFASQEFEKLSTQNSENRSKQLYSPAQGSSTMISQMKAKMSSHGSAPLVTSATSSSSSRDDRHDPKGKRLREETRGCSVEKELRRLKTDRLKVEFCEKTWKPILDHDKMFLNILAKIVTDTIPASTTTWKDMKKEDIELILIRMEMSEV